MKKEQEVSSLRSWGSLSIGIDDVTGEDVELQLIAEFPPRDQLHVDLVASQHLQYDHLKCIKKERDLLKADTS